MVVLILVPRVLEGQSSIPNSSPRPALSPAASPDTPVGSSAQSPIPVPPRAPAAPTAPPRFLIVLDAAHGGDDLGGHLSSGQLEKNANLALSVRLRSLLGARGIQVVTTRESDQSVDLNRRAEIANHAAARACISLHTADTGIWSAPVRFVADARTSRPFSGVENGAGGLGDAQPGAGGGI